ncbi:tRNA (guanosine(46)-N7)-methyltransferase TrmB [Luteococcus sanguinis]|uniref:tRNA (guanine-N(7)-)-methyltransferase n=1 Tax=Luteococcus sanguinis TaxID=174038 RepID=A0ABW1WY96_9ACTN
MPEPEQVASARPDATRVHREVVSFVRRSARMNPSQRKAWDTWRGCRVVEVERRETTTSVADQPPVDWTAVFGREAELCVEIGSGTGETLAALAVARPEANIIGFEVFEPAMASTLSRLARAGVDNVRLVQADAAQGLLHLFEPSSITELCTFFPDPWHKTRHHKRRLVSPGFAELVASRLVPGGLWRLATDWDDYAEWMREVLDVADALENVHAADGGWAPRLDARPVTNFEAKGLRAGRTIRDLTYRRLP